MPKWIRYGFPPPEFLRFNFAGINISDHSIKICKSVLDKDHYLIEVIDTISLPDGSVVNGELKNPGEVIKVLQKIKDTYGINFVRMSVPEELIYLASFNIPPTPREKLRSVVEFHIGDHIPVPVDEIQFDYDEIKVKNGKVIEVVVIAIPRTAVVELMDVLEKADLIPLSLEVEAQAIARVVTPKDASNKTYLVLDLGRSRTGISIIENGVVRYTTTVSFGGDLLVKKIAKIRSISFEEAEKVKRADGVLLERYSDKEQTEIKTVLADITSEIKRRDIFWQNQTGEAIDEVLLVGGNASTPNLARFLQKETGFSVTVPDIWANVYSPEESERPVAANESLSYAAVIGLAINEEK